MEVKDLKPKTGDVDIVLDIVEKGGEREFNKFGKPGRVCTAKAKDETGEVKLTLWNEQIDEVKAGDKVHLTNGWVSEFQGEMQLSTGKFGKLEIVGKAEEQPAEAPAEEAADEPEVKEEKIE